MLYNVHFGIDVDVAMTVEDKSKSLLPFLSGPKLLPDESEAEFQSGLRFDCGLVDGFLPAIAHVSNLRHS